ncbi:MAG: hypothetical protein CMM00_00455 [Rhodopirellula sp.]|nr:hypothetical protein [Rhodopirellula sp.]
MGEVERRRSGVGEGGGRAWEAARIALPGNLTERSLSDPSRCSGGVLKALLEKH